MAILLYFTTIESLTMTSTNKHHISHTVRPLRCYEDIYQIYRNGRIESIDASIPDPIADDFMGTVQLQDRRGRVTIFSIDLLVLKNFGEHFEPWAKISHSDGNRFNHSADNLSQDTI